MLRIISILIIFSLYSCDENSNNPTSSMKESKIKAQLANNTAPIAKKVDKALAIHGDTRNDQYYWLNERGNQDVIDYLNNENTYTDGLLKPLEAKIDALYEEMIDRIEQKDISVPYKDNGYFYLNKYEEGKEYRVYSRKKGSLESEEEVILDVNKLAKGHSYYAAAGLRVSPNNKILAFGQDTVSRRIYTIRFKDLTTGKMLADEIPQTTGGAVWANDNKTVFYTVKDKSLRSYKIFRHILGTDSKNDEEIYHEADETFGTFVYKTKSKKYIVIGSFQTLTSEYRVLDANNPMGSFQLFEPRNKAEKLEYGINHYDDKWYIRTNYKAENFRLMSTPVTALGRENWTEVIPHRSDVLLEGVDIFKDFMVVSERTKGITQLNVKPWKGESHYIDFGEDAFVAYTSTNREFETDEVRIGYQSMSTPNTIYDYDVNTKAFDIKKQTKVLGGFNKEDYVTERIYADARDGVKVPVSLMYHKNTKIDGTAPLMLYGYGSYGNSMDPFFSSSRLSLVDRGFVYAIAHVRGGEELGRQWYENGKLLNKKNTFYDFIDCGEYLLKNNYGDPNRTCAQGGSAGGLLMGAVINYRPDLFKNVISAVPFVDVITTMLDETIPLTTGEFDEWGNPKDKKYYDYIKEYSPYDNVESKEYPNLLVTTGYHDSQVQYWEPAKWVAKLRDMKKGNQVLMLKTDMEAGHGGASGRFKRFKDTAKEYTFLLDMVGA